MRLVGKLLVALGPLKIDGPEHTALCNSFCFLLQTSSHEDIFTFEISQTLATDAGRYVVIATNTEGVERCSVSLNVRALDNTESTDFRTLLKSRLVTDSVLSVTYSVNPYTLCAQFAQV